MTDRRTQMLEDRYLRDSARALVEADVAHLKADLAQKGVGARIADRAKEGATDLYDEAVDMAGDNKGAIAALLGAVVLWLARNPILSMFGWGDQAEEDEEWDLRDELAERLRR